MRAVHFKVLTHWILIHLSRWRTPSENIVSLWHPWLSWETFSQYLPIKCLASILCGIAWPQALGLQHGGLAQHHWKAIAELPHHQLGLWFSEKKSSVIYLVNWNSEEVFTLSRGNWGVICSIMHYHLIHERIVNLLLLTLFREGSSWRRAVAAALSWKWFLQHALLASALFHADLFPESVSVSPSAAPHKPPPKLMTEWSSAPSPMPWWLGYQTPPLDREQRVIPLALLPVNILASEGLPCHDTTSWALDQ